MRWGRMVGTALLTLCALGCAANHRVAEPAEALPEISAQANEQQSFPAAGAHIESIWAEPGDSETLVTIRGDHPLSYTSYDPDSATLVLEMPDVDGSALDSVIEVGSSHLDRIEVTSKTSKAGGSHTRLEFVGRNSAETRIEPREEDLVIVLSGNPILAADSMSSGQPQDATAGREMTQADVAPVVARQEPVDLEDIAPSALFDPKGPASALEAIRIAGDEENPVVILEGDGALEYRTFELENPQRLVIDVVDVRNDVAFSRMPVKAGSLDQIRVSQFSVDPERIARVVFDMNGPEPYVIEREGSELSVTFQSGNAEVARTESFTTVSSAAAMEPRSTVASNPPASAFEAPKPAPSELEAEAFEPETSDDYSSSQPDVRPASSSLRDMGRDVVLFDQASAKPMQQGGGDAPAMGVNMNTLPSSIFESRTIAGGRRTYRGEKISVAFRDADLREVMFFFADVMKMNVVLDPDVTGKVDIRLNQVPWDQAFQVILKNQGLDAVEEENVVRIAKTSKLRQEAADLRSLKQAEDQAVDPVTFTRTLSYAKVQDALSVLQQIKTDRGKIVADIRTNTLIISDIPKKKSEYEGLLDTIDTQTPQVIIEARIVEAIRAYERDLGINWAVAGAATPALGTQTSLQFPHRVEFNADVNTAPAGFPSAGSIGLMLGNVLDSFTLDVSLEAFEADGKVRILSSPKVATQNNQPAMIEQGVQIPVVTTTATEVDVQYVPASLRLIVTPQITAEDTVIMKLKVENNQPSSTISVADVPGIVTESVDTQILVRTGTTAVIGGVYKLQESENETGIPGLRKIPFFGWLFKNRVNKKDSSELLVFITPKIVKNI